MKWKTCLLVSGLLAIFLSTTCASSPPVGPWWIQMSRADTEKTGVEKLDNWTLTATIPFQVAKDGTLVGSGDLQVTIVHPDPLPTDCEWHVQFPGTVKLTGQYKDKAFDFDELYYLSCGSLRMEMVCNGELATEEPLRTTLSDLATTMSDFMSELVTSDPGRYKEGIEEPYRNIWERTGHIWELKLAQLVASWEKAEAYENAHEEYLGQEFTPQIEAKDGAEANIEGWSITLHQGEPPSATPVAATFTPIPRKATPAPSPTPEPATVRVAPDGSGDYASLEAAVEALPSGSTIMIEAGSYRLEEPLDINKALRLVGTGMDQTEIVSEAEGYVVRFNGDGPFAAEGITFRHQGEAVADVVVVMGGEVDLTRCRFTGAYEEEDDRRGGLRLAKSTTGVVRDCVAGENEGSGIMVVSQARPALEGNLCADNKLAGIIYGDNAGGVARRNECPRNWGGILVSAQAQPTLEENLCTDNEVVGIGYADNAGGEARQNECVRNGLSGIRVTDQAQPTLEGNVCTDNEESGIAYHGDSGGGVARQNECTGNKLGIFVAAQAQPTLEENVCTDNETFGIGYYGDSAGGVARQNDCSQNWGGISVAAQAQPTLEENLCTDNEVVGIGYSDSASGVARQNDCSRNMTGIFVIKQAHPTLEENICTDNEEGVGIRYGDNASGVARQNDCSQNWGGISVAAQAQPTLEGNVCTDNEVFGIGYSDNAGGVARQNECASNGECGIYVAETADPDLMDNNCHDNTEEDIRDLRP